MIVGLRILALVIDCAVCFYTMPVLFFGIGWLMENTGSWGLLVIPLAFVLFIVWPFAYFGVTTGLWGKTPGKFICRLNVVYVGGRPGLWRGLGRETLKLLAVGSGIGAMLTLFQIIYYDQTWYDQICGTGVNFTPYRRPTATQRRYRKFMKEQRRGRNAKTEDAP